MMTFAVLLFLYSFLRTVFFIGLFYYLFRFLFRVILPVMGLYRASKTAANHQKAERRNEGEVRVENSRQNQPRYSRDEGEYVDFEEID